MNNSTPVLEQLSYSCLNSNRNWPGLSHSATLKVMLISMLQQQKLLPRPEITFMVLNYSSACFTFGEKRAMKACEMKSIASPLERIKMEIITQQRSEKSRRGLIAMIIRQRWHDELHGGEVSNAPATEKQISWLAREE